MTIGMVIFGNISKPKKPSKFENWLSDKGFFYIKTKNNRPCFKSKLTQNLKKKFDDEVRKSNQYKISLYFFKFA